MDPWFRSSHWGLATQFGERYIHIGCRMSDGTRRRSSCGFDGLPPITISKKKYVVSTFHLEGRKRASVLFSSRLLFPKSSCPTSPVLAIYEKKKKVRYCAGVFDNHRPRERNNKVMLTGLPSRPWCPLSYYSILSWKKVYAWPPAPPVDDDDNNNKL